jgi:hypothetical protein
MYSTLITELKELKDLEIKKKERKLETKSKQKEENILAAGHH